MIFSFLAIIHVLQWTFLNKPFSVFLAIFHVLKCVYFRDFQFSHSRSFSGHFSFFTFFSDFFLSSRQVNVSHFP
ncbi:Uncharacterised protein [Chlamydia abortus]|nr:Uncharacterised protein [Chlamydia abortus]